MLVVPDIAKSLLSVSKLTRDYPCMFEFRCDKIGVKDMGTQQKLTLGRIHEDFLPLGGSTCFHSSSSKHQTASNEV